MISVPGRNSYSSRVFGIHVVGAVGVGCIGAVSVGCIGAVSVGCIGAVSVGCIGCIYAICIRRVERISVFARHPGGTANGLHVVVT
jgi:hypothetical protein